MSLSRTAAASPPEIATLLGARGLNESILCLASLQHHSLHPFQFRLHDDGSLTSEDLARLRAAIPISRVVSRAEGDAEAARRLAALPACARLRRENVLALKLFDIVWFEESDTLRYVDSDVLFLRPFSGPPAGPLEASASPRAVFFPDRQSAYSIRPWQLFGRRSWRFPARLNTGLFTLQKSVIDFERLEPFLAQWRGFAPVWIEQTCWALLAGTTATALLDPAQFRIHEPRRGVGEEVVALHFVSSVRGDLARVAKAHPSPSGAAAVAARLRPAKPLGLATALHEALRRRIGS